MDRNTARSRSPLRQFLICSVLLLAASHLSLAATPTLDERVDLLFRPPVAEQIALAPDGAHVAYTRIVGSALTLSIVDPAAPAKRLSVTVDEGRVVLFSKEKDPARLRYLRWATPTRLVFAPTPHRIPLSASTAGSPLIAPIMAVDADGKNPTTLVDSQDMGVTPILNAADDFDGPPRPSQTRYRTTDILGFAAGDHSHLLVQANGFLGQATNTPTQLLRVDVRTGETTTVSEDTAGARYIYDWQAHARLSFAPGVTLADRRFQYLPPSGKGRWNALEPHLSAWTPKDLQLTSDNVFGDRAFPLGFDFDPNILYVASNIGRDSFGIYAANLTTGQRTALSLDRAQADLADVQPAFPSPALVFDEYRQQLAGVRLTGARPLTVWKDDDLASIQVSLETQFPDYTPEILDWTADHTRFLLRVTSGKDPGRCFVFFRPEKKMQEITQRAPWLTPDVVYDTKFFEFTSPDGAHLTGYLTLPRQTRLATPPLVLCFTSELPGRAHAEFDPEAHVLASMGFVVARLNQRGTTGLGRSHRDAITGGIDRVPVADALATIDWLATRHSIDRKRVVALGRGFGGYLAVRAAQLEPDAFRAAVAIDAPLDPNTWLPDVPRNSPARDARRTLLERGAPNVRALSILDKPETVTRPLFLVVETNANEAIDTANSRLRSKLKSLGRVVEEVEVDHSFALGLPQSRTRVYRQLDQFFNINVYDYEVKVGPATEVK